MKATLVTMCLSLLPIELDVFNKAVFAQCLYECRLPDRAGADREPNPDHWHCRLLRARCEGHVAAAPPKSVMNSLASSTLSQTKGHPTTSLQRSRVVLYSKFGGQCLSWISKQHLYSISDRPVRYNRNTIIDT
jgi:hypothetical protein